MEEENTKTVPLWIGITGLILIIACIIFDCNELKDSLQGEFTTLGVINYVATMLTLMFAALYFMMGFKKDAAVYYKLFIWMFAVQTLVVILLAKDLPMYILIIELIKYTVLSVLALGKDLGKRRSYTLSILRIVCDVASTVLIISAIGTKALSNVLSVLLLSVLMFVMVNAKYADKEIRGTK